MREILVRNLTSNNWLRRDCTVTELMRQGEFLTKVVRRCTYNVESKTTLPATQDSIRWAETLLDPHQPRQVYVTKELDPDTQGEKVIYKVLGHFYVVWGQDVYCIGYRHVLSMDIETTEALETE